MTPGPLSLLTAFAASGVEQFDMSARTSMSLFTPVISDARDNTAQFVGRVNVDT